jgi:hypothetical protein
MSDRLKSIKIHQVVGGLSHDEDDWLISEVERLRAKNERLIKEFKDLDIFVNLCDADERAIQPYEIGDRISFALKEDKLLRGENK